MPIISRDKPVSLAPVDFAVRYGFSALGSLVEEPAREPSLHQPLTQELPQPLSHSLSLAALRDESRCVSRPILPPAHRRKTGWDFGVLAIRPRASDLHLFNLPELALDCVEGHLAPNYPDIAALRRTSRLTFDWVGGPSNRSFGEENVLKVVSNALLYESVRLFPVIYACDIGEVSSLLDRSLEDALKYHDCEYHESYNDTFIYLTSIGREPADAENEAKAIAKARAEEKTCIFWPENFPRVISQARLSAVLERVLSDYKKVDFILKPFLDRYQILMASNDAADMLKASQLSELMEVYSNLFYQALISTKDSKISSLTVDFPAYKVVKLGDSEAFEHALHDAGGILDSLKDLEKLTLRSAHGSYAELDVAQFSPQSLVIQKWNPPTNFLNSNTSLKYLTLITNLSEALTCLLQDNSKQIEEAVVSPGLENVRELTLDVQALAELGRANAAGYRNDAGGWINRHLHEQEQLLRLVFSGLRKATQIRIVAGKSFEGFIDHQQAVAEGDAPIFLDSFTPSQLINVIAQAPVVSRLELPKYLTFDGNLVVTDFEKFVLDTADRLSNHPTLASLQIGDFEFKRSDVFGKLTQISSCQ
jgi:hypothetical protein